MPRCPTRPELRRVPELGVSLHPGYGEHLRRYSEELRVEVIEYAVRREHEGDTRVDVARELGLTHRTLWGWLHRHHEPIVKPVEIVDETETETEAEARCLVLPGGSRIEGLSIEDVVVLVRALS